MLLSGGVAINLTQGLNIFYDPYSIDCAISGGVLVKDHTPMPKLINKKVQT